MSKPVVTIVGRPNVGKSTLFNRLVGERKALVDDMPGVTRDRHYGEVYDYGRSFTVIDTGGYDPDAEDQLLSLMREQAQLAMDEADVIVLLVDGKEGLTRTDEVIAEQLRRGTTPVFVAVNKLESERRRAEAYDFYRLGVEELLFISAAHGIGVGDLMERVVAALPEPDGDEIGGEDFDPSEIRVAVVGRPNVGKSTLVNKLLGEERLLASDLPGTTRDAIDTILDVQREDVQGEGGSRRYRIIDTAGIRRKRSIKLRLETYSVIKAFKSIDRAHVVILLIDATEPFVEQEARLAGMIHDKGRAAIIAVNKWDLVEKDTHTAGTYVRRLREHLNFMTYAPVVFLSAKSGQRVHKLLPLVDHVVENHRRRVPTAQLNRFLSEALEAHQLPISKRKRVKIFYLTQVSIGPPTFVAVCNISDGIHFSYERYLVNGIREAFEFDGTPIRLKFKARSRRSRGADLPDDPVAAAAQVEAERSRRDDSGEEWDEPEWDESEPDAGEAVGDDDSESSDFDFDADLESDLESGPDPDEDPDED